MDVFGKIFDWILSILEKFLSLIGIDINPKYLMYGISLCCLICVGFYIKMSMGGIS